MPIKAIVKPSSKEMYENYHFSDATVSGGHLFCSGVIGTGDTVLEEFRNAWAKIGEVLSEAGLDYTDIVEYTSFHIALTENLADFMTARDEVISEPWPAWTAIGVAELGRKGSHVEIRVTAKMRE